MPLPRHTGVSETQTLPGTKGKKGEPGWTLSPCPDFLNSWSDSLTWEFPASSLVRCPLPYEEDKDMVGCMARSSDKEMLAQYARRQVLSGQPSHGNTLEGAPKCRFLPRCSTNMGHVHPPGSTSSSFPSSRRAGAARMQSLVPPGADQPQGIFAGLNNTKKSSVKSPLCVLCHDKGFEEKERCRTAVFM